MLDNIFQGIVERIEIKFRKAWDENTLKELVDALEAFELEDSVSDIICEFNGVSFSDLSKDQYKMLTIMISFTKHKLINRVEIYRLELNGIEQKIKLGGATLEQLEQIVADIKEWYHPDIQDKEMMERYKSLIADLEQKIKLERMFAVN